MVLVSWVLNTPANPLHTHKTKHAFRMFPFKCKWHSRHGASKWPARGCGQKVNSLLDSTYCEKHCIGDEMCTNVPKTTTEKFVCWTAYVEVITIPARGDCMTKPYITLWTRERCKFEKLRAFAPQSLAMVATGIWHSRHGATKCPAHSCGEKDNSLLHGTNCEKHCIRDEMCTNVPRKHTERSVSWTAYVEVITIPARGDCRMTLYRTVRMRERCQFEQIRFGY